MAGVLFNKSQTTLIAYPGGKTGNYIVPNSVTNIGVAAFAHCTNFASITIPDSVNSIGDFAFSYCTNLTNVTIGDGVTSIGGSAFASCISLTNVTIPSNVSIIGLYAFLNSTNLTEVYFWGNAPDFGFAAFYNANHATLYHLPGTAGWGAWIDGRPTTPWLLPNPVILDFGPSFGVQTNQFGFIISWATNLPVVVEACADLGAPAWSPLATNTLAEGWSYFSDPQWTNYPSRFYRIRSP